MPKKIAKIKNDTKENLKKYLLKIWEIIKKPEMAILPGQLAFFMLLSLVPIITFLGFSANIFNINIEFITNLIKQYVPGNADFLINYINGDNLDFKLTFILIWMLYLASNGCNTVILISNQIYGINKSNWIKRRIKAIFMTLAIVLFMLLVLVIPVYGMRIIELFGFVKISKKLHSLLSILKLPLMWLVMFIFLRTIYEIAPDRVRKNSHMNTGALFTSTGWIIVTNIYSHLSKNMVTYNIFYGALSNIAIIMLWLYFMSFIFVIGLSLHYGQEAELETMNKTGAIKIVKAG